MIKQDYTIEIVIAPDGSIHSEVLDMKGESCEDAISILDQLPGQVMDEGHTADYDKKPDDPKREQHRTRPVELRRH